MKSKDLRLLLSLGSSRKLFIGAVFGALINTAIVIANGFLIATIIVGIINDRPDIPERLIELALLWATRAIFNSTFDRWASSQATALKSALRTSILDSPESLQAIPSTHLSTLLIKGANSLDIYLARFLPQMFGASIIPIAVIVALTFLDPLSGITALLTIPLIPIFGALIGRYTQDAVTAKWQSLGTLGKYFEDSLRGLHTLSIFGRIKSQEARIEEMGDRYTRETMKVLRISFLSALVLELAATISVALIAVSIGIRLVHGSMDFWSALAVLVLAPEVYLPLRNAASLFHASADGGAALSQLTSAIVEPSLTSSAQGRDIERIESISWDSWSSPFSLGQLPAATLSRSNVLVIRGGSGLGKTTFFNAILGFRDADKILINGSEHQSFESSSLRREIGWIPQSPQLISGSLRELFRLLKDDASDLEIETLLVRVGLPLTSLPQGLDTQLGGLGEKSGHLSGGQIRRIAIARALFINPSLIVADEPTADLDPVAAQEILKIFTDLSSNGVIVIAVLHAPDHQIPGAQEIEMVER